MNLFTNAYELHPGDVILDTPLTLGIDTGRDDHAVIRAVDSMGALCSMSAYEWAHVAVRIQMSAAP
jgi:hypothetical protein